MYHSISPQDDIRRHPYYTTNTTPERFREHMSYLWERGYRSVSIPEVVAHLQNSSMNDTRLVAITFDDGYKDFQEHALGVLKEYGYSATVFLSTGHIGYTRLSLLGRACLTWGEVRSLCDEGISFGSHTVTHPQLETLSREAVRVELRNSREEIQRELETEVEVFSYPYAFPRRGLGIVDWLGQELSEAGYRYAVTTLLGMATRREPQLQLPRIPMNSFDDPRLFGAKLEGAYDWLRSAQQAWKVLKRRASN